jgi:hypothetical protein
MGNKEKVAGFYFEDTHAAAKGCLCGPVDTTVAAIEGTSSRTLDELKNQAELKFEVKIGGHEEFQAPSTGVPRAALQACSKCTLMARPGNAPR